MSGPKGGFIHSLPLCECGHGEACHFDDSDGMVTDGACESGRWTGVRCKCIGFTAIAASPPTEPGTPGGGT